MSGPVCILCNSDRVRLVETIRTADLVKLYSSRANVDVARLFTHATIDLVACNNCGLGFYFPVVIGDGQFYDDLQKYPGYYLEDKPEYEEAARFIHPSEKVLEIGAGEGGFTRFLAGNQYVGLELSSKAIRSAQGKGITLLKEDLASFATDHHESFDIVCCFQVLEHVPHPGAFLSNALHCLKKKGKLILAVPSEDSFIRHAVNFYLNMPPHHVSRWTDGTLKALTVLFELELLSLFHEKIHPIHQAFFHKTRINAFLRRMLGMKSTRTDLSVPGFLTYGLAVMIAKFLPPVKAQNGQSVLAVYEKK